MKRLLHLAALLVACAAAMTPARAAEDAYAAMLGRWQAKLVGPASMDRGAPDVAAQLRAQAEAATKAQASMNSSPARALWEDLSDFKNPLGWLASAAVTGNATHLLNMAKAYGSPGTAAYRDAALGRSIAKGLDWLLREHYHAGLEQYGNWWDWQIGTPQHLLDVLSLSGDAIPPELPRPRLAAVNWFVPDARYKTRSNGTLDKQHLETAANLLDKAQVMILSGMLGKEAKRIADGRDAIGPALQYVTSGDGFYRDGTFIQHGYTPYAGNYGVVALQVYGRLLHLLNGSQWSITDPNISNVYRWARISFADLLVDGAVPDVMRGRKISVYNQVDHGVGRGLVAAVAAIADVAPASDQAQLRAIVKGAMQRDRTYGKDYLAGASGTGTSSLGLYDLALLKAIMADPAIPSAAEPLGPHLYPSMDRAFLRGPGFTVVLAMASPRINAFTNGNGENLQGWWGGMGTLSLYDAHQDQFGNNYWATVDWWRLPGTTTDHSGKGLPKEWARFPNAEQWVGGASLGSYAAIGMVFTLREVTGSDLHGRKAWFFLGDRLLALGSGIGGGQDKVETIVENRRLADPGGARMLVDGEPLQQGTVKRAAWAHLQDDNAGSRIGYVFPDGAALQLERSERSGSWRTINTSGPETVLRNTFQVLSMPQTSSNYAYLLMPNASEEATRAAAANPGVRIESNDDQAAAIYVAPADTYAANLWKAGHARLGGDAFVSSSGPVAVVLTRADGQLRVAVADPTQQQSALELTINQAAGKVIASSPGVTVLATAPQLRLKIDTANSQGATFQASFTLK